MCNIGQFKNEFKIISFAAIKKKMILKRISTNWLCMEITFTLLRACLIVGGGPQVGEVGF